MRRFLVGLLCLCALVLAGCGGDGTSTDSSESGAVVGPQKLVIKNLKVGSGPAAQRGDQVGVLYQASYWGSDEIGISRWGAGVPPQWIRLGAGKFATGWEKGMEGMRVGGERKLVIPARLTDNEGPLVYRVRLVRLKPASGS